MPLQPTLRRAHSVRSARSQHVTRRVNPMFGQTFDVEISRAIDGWTVRIPEIGGLTHARRRTTVEVAARECIAAMTGIPIGYVAVFIAAENFIATENA